MTTTNDAAPAVIDHPIGSHGRLAIRLASAELRLVGTDGDAVVVRTPNGAKLSDRILVETVDGGLTIREKEVMGLTFSIGRRVVQLEIEVPATADVTIDTASGWLDAQGLRGDQHYRTVSGETRLGAGSGRIELNTVSGDATIELADTADLAIKSVSGDVSVAGARLSGLRIATTSGDVRVGSPLVGRTGNTIETLSGDVLVVAGSGMRVEARTVSGDLTSDLPHRSEGRMGRRTLIVGDGSVELGFRSVSGDLLIRGVADPASRSERSGTAWSRAADETEWSSGPTAPRAPRLPSLPARPVMPRMPSLPGTPPAAGPGSSTDDRAGWAATGLPHPDPDPLEAERMAILRSLEQGELDVPSAMERLAALDEDPAPVTEAADAGERPGDD
jgi:hypothetical protein